MAGKLSQLDREQIIVTQSPEYFPYHPSWGRLKPELRARLSNDVAQFSRLTTRVHDQRHRSNLDWLTANFEFTLLLDEVSRDLEPAYRLKERWLGGEVESAELPAQVASARAAFKAVPIEPLFRTFARRVRSRGELGELSALNQKLWLQYRELDDFLRSLENGSPSAGAVGSTGSRR